MSIAAALRGWAGALLRAGRTRREVAQQATRIEHHDARIEHHNARIEHQDARIEHHDARIEHHDARIERQDERIDELGRAIDASVAGASQGIGEVRQWLANLQANVDRRGEWLGNVAARCDALEHAHGALHAEAAQFDQRLRTLEQALSILETRAGELGAHRHKDRFDIDRLALAGNAARKEFDALRMQLATLGRRDDGEAGSSSAYPLDRAAFERRFRGASGDVAGRMQVYRDDAAQAWRRCAPHPACDIGCGRGDWLALLRTWSIPAFGIDANRADVEACVAKGLDARCQDAIDALRGCEEGSLCLVTVFHVVEHLMFADFALLVAAAFRALAPGGAMIVETPNAENLVVSSTTFHLDPTHRKPIPAALLQFVLADAGFETLRVEYLHTDERLNAVADAEAWPAGLRALVCAAQDVGVIAWKPAR